VIETEAKAFEMSADHRGGKSEMSSQSERIPTGIPGLDELIEGGVMRNDVHVLAGGPGTGKTLFSLNFVKNALAGGERVLYATFEESPVFLRRNAQLVGIDLSGAEKEKRLTIVDLEALRDSKESTINFMISALEETESTLIVVDSLTALLTTSQNELELRTYTKALYKALRHRHVTSMMTTSILDPLKMGLEAFLADSVMLLENYMQGTEFRTRFLVLKMRATDHDKQYHSVIFGPGFGVSKY